MRKIIYVVMMVIMSVVTELYGDNKYVSDEQEDDGLIAIEENIEIETKNEGEKLEIIDEAVALEKEAEVLYGKMTAYGPDCYGCSGYLAYQGIYVGNGNIYYEDSQYGKVRIVAADKSIAFGSIIEINDDILAIVLDRGGAIGFGRFALFDLLFSSEAEANQFGMVPTAKFEILRNGF